MHFGQSSLAVMFADESFGVATDLGGGIYYTEDGGDSWRYSEKAGASRVGLEVADRNSIWHIGVGGAVRHSVDGAHAWQFVSSLPYGRHVEYLSFADDGNGWMVTTELRTFYITADGAKTWRAEELPGAMGAPAALHLRTPRDGYLLDAAGNLFITADGGDSWRMQSIGLADGITLPTLNHSAAMRFVDGRRGLIVLSVIDGDSGRVFALRTEDGGATWAEESLPVTMGMFHLSRNGEYLTHVDLVDQGKITLLCSSKLVNS
jgi:photosystem II stability/assembly factor-like uncharacterized protein